MGSSAVALDDIPSVDIMIELLRRFKCSSKPDKRLILVGVSFFLILLFLIKCLIVYSFYKGFIWWFTNVFVFDLCISLLCHKLLNLYILNFMRQFESGYVLFDLSYAQAFWGFCIFALPSESKSYDWKFRTPNSQLFSLSQRHCILNYIKWMAGRPGSGKGTQSPIIKDD